MLKLMGQQNIRFQGDDEGDDLVSEKLKSGAKKSIIISQRANEKEPNKSRTAKKNGRSKSGNRKSKATTKKGKSNNSDEKDQFMISSIPGMSQQVTAVSTIVPTKKRVSIPKNIGASKTRVSASKKRKIEGKLNYFLFNFKCRNFKQRTFNRL